MWRRLHLVLETSARLLRLLSALQRRRRWAGEELAEYTGVTDRTLRRDVDRLRSLGYVVDAVAGPGGGYQLGRGSIVPPLLLDDAEAIAVTVALRAAADAFVGLGETALGVLVKLEQLLPKRLARRVTAVHAVTVSIPSGTAPIDPERLTTIAAACRDHEVLSLRYRARDHEVSSRTVEPVRLAHTPSRRWYLVAWDRGRGDVRTFRVDRIEGCDTTGERFAPRRLPKDVSTYVEEALAFSSQRFQVRARLEGPLEHLKTKVPAWCGTLSAGADQESATIDVGGESIETVASLLLLTGVPFEVKGPPETARAVAAVARRLLEGCEKAGRVGEA